MYATAIDARHGQSISRTALPVDQYLVRLNIKMVSALSPLPFYWTRGCLEHVHQTLILASSIISIRGLFCSTTKSTEVTPSSSLSCAIGVQVWGCSSRGRWTPHCRSRDVRHEASQPCSSSEVVFQEIIPSSRRNLCSIYVDTSELSLQYKYWRAHII